MAVEIADLEALFSRTEDLLSKAEVDPDLLRDLVDNPLEVARAAGVDVSLLLKMLLGVPDAADTEVLDVLQSRVAGARRRLSCGTCHSRRPPRPHP